MCQAIFKPANQTLDPVTLRRCFDRNPHGAGFAYAVNNKLNVRKGFFTFEEFWDAFNPIQEGAPAIIHFRYASAGVISPENCHPFRIDANHAMIHNGTFWDFADAESKQSDTGHYTSKLLRPLFKRDQHFWKTNIGHYLLVKTMGYSKMIILSNNGKVGIVNEEAGQWAGEENESCWFSNDGYLEESEYCGTTFPRQLYFNLTYPIKQVMGQETA